VQVKRLSLHGPGSSRGRRAFACAAFLVAAAPSAAFAQPSTASPIPPAGTTAPASTPVPAAAPATGPATSTAPAATTAAPPATAPAAATPPLATTASEPARVGVPSSEPGQEGGSAGTGSGAPTTVPSVQLPRTGLLAPQFPEDYYPGMAKQDGILQGIPIDEKRGLRFAMHGYFRAPMLITRSPRADGSTKPGEGSANYRTPYLVDNDYFASGFSYTPVNETDFAELYLSVGNDHVTATIQFQGSLYSDSATTDISRQPGLSQGWLTYRTDLDFIPYFKTRLRVKGGAFWERYGYLPKYDTYIFARTHQIGENVRLEFERGDFTFWVQHGLGTHLEDVQNNEGLTLLHYASIGASWARTIELGGYVFDNSARDKRPLSQLTDASLGVIGVDVRADTHFAGRFYGATSYITADQATYTAPAIEVMHSNGGRGITENYLGTQSSNNGSGSLWNVGFQYDLSLAEITKAWTGQSTPLPWHGDVTASLFGVYTFVQSTQQSQDPLVNKDDRKMFKWGVDGGYRITEWMSASLRYDRVVLDVDDSANSFRIISPRLAFFTSFLTREMLYVQYSRYVYNERIRLRTGQQNLETMPDDHVLKIQAQMTF
jgi:hypothetical protein